MICCTCGGAPAGATARPSGPTVAWAPGATAGGGAGGGGGGGGAGPAGGGGRRRRRRRRRPGGRGGAQRVDVGGVELAVDREAVGLLELLDGLERPAAELAVDRDVVAGVAEQVLQDPDVRAAHAALDRDAVAEALALLVGAGRVEAAADVGAPALQRRLQRGDGLAADGAAGGQLRGALEALDRADGRGAELPVDLDGEARLAQGLLELADVLAAGAAAQRAVPEVRARRALGDGSRRSDRPAAEQDGEDR